MKRMWHSTLIAVLDWNTSSRGSNPGQGHWNVRQTTISKKYLLIHVFVWLDHSRVPGRNLSW